MTELFCGISSASYKSFNAVINNTATIKVFQIKLSSFYRLINDLSLYLSNEELDHSERYRFEKERNQYIICRSLLKFILSHHTKIAIQDIRIALDKHKKPYLTNNKLVCFNLSHSHDYAVIAVGNTFSIGIDIEYINHEFVFSC